MSGAGRLPDRRLLGVFVLALVLRAAYLWQMADADLFRFLVGDGAAYHAWAVRVASGDWLGGDVFYQAPLYPYLMAAVYAVLGPDPFWVRLVQLVLGAGACVFLCQAGRAFFSPTVGVVAGVLLALYPTAIFFDGLIQKSALDLFLATALLGALGSLGRHPAARRWGLAGLLLGGLALTRENALALVPIVLAWLWVAFRETPGRQRLRWAACFAGGLAMVLLPVGARNAVVGGEFHLTTAQLGPNLYIGNHAGATGRYVALRAGRGSAEVERTDATELAEEALGRRLGPAEVSRFWTERALAWIASDPAAWMRLTVRKWLLVWNAVEVTDTEDQLTYGDHSSLLAALTALFHFGVLCPLAALGVWATWGDRRRLWVLYAIALALALSVTLFFVVARYRYPLVPVLALFAAAGLVRGRAMVQGRRWRELAAGGAVVAVAAVAVNWRLVDPDSQRAPTRYNLGVQLAAAGDLAGARRQFAEAIRLDPSLGVAWSNLGIVLAMEGEGAAAERHFREALRREPGLAEAWGNLGVLLVRGGRSAEAIEHFRAAVRLRPTWAEAHRGLGEALAAEGRLAEAVAPLEAAVRLAPGHAAAAHALGVVLARQGRTGEAVVHLRRARELAAAAHDDALGAEVAARLAALGEAAPAGPVR
jgi:tetratricopeptide (TPR) repeat protein